MSESQIELTLDEEIEMAEKRHAELLERKKQELAEKRTAALAPVLAAIREHGFTAAELGVARAPVPKREPGAPKAERASVTLAAKYRDEATGAEWAGRGKMPRWLTAHIDAGRDASEFLVAKLPIGPNEPASPGVVLSAGEGV